MVGDVRPEAEGTGQQALVEAEVEVGAEGGEPAGEAVGRSGRAGQTHNRAEETLVTGCVLVLPGRTGGIAVGRLVDQEVVGGVVEGAGGALEGRTAETRSTTSGTSLATPS